MDIAARGAGKKGAVLRFGIRWDDGRRPKRFLLPLAAALAALAITPAAAGAQSAAASSDVVRTATGVTGSAGAGVGVALLDSGVVPLGGLDRPGALVVGPELLRRGR